MRALFLTFLLISCNAFGFEIYALGTSNTNCKSGNQAYTKKLNQLLQQHNINATVINGGVNGDKPHWMLNRLKTSINKETKIVIFEPGPNESNKKFSMDASSDVLTYLQAIGMPTLYVSNYSIQTPEEAEPFAIKHNAYYYGNWSQGIPVTAQYRAYDQPWSEYPAGHMTAEGCEMWAEQMIPALKKIIDTYNIK
jgi:hypothetical protein